MSDKDRIRELEQAIEQIKEAVFEPKSTLPRVKHAVAQILAALKGRKSSGGSLDSD